MTNFRKIAAASAGKQLLTYYREHEPGPMECVGLTPDGRQLASGTRLTTYYAGRDRRATWRPDMPLEIARALGIDRHRMPGDTDLERLFECKRADTGEAWSEHHRKISALDLTLTPHKSVSLVAEMAKSPAERALVWNAIDRAADYAMRVVAGDLGWARKGDGGNQGADPGAVGWASFRHHNARPTLAVQDGPDGVTHLKEAPIVGDPNSHIHFILFNVVATEDGRVGSLDTKELTKTRLHYYDAIFQARLADDLRAMGMRTSLHPKEKAIVLDAVPEAASVAFSKRTKQVLRSAKAYAKGEGLDWDTMSAEGKFRILAVSGLASRLKKNGGRGEEEAWVELAEAVGWKRESALEGAVPEQMTDTERFDRAYRFAARHLAREFHTAAVIEHDKLRLYAAMGLIGLGMKGGVADVDRVVELIENRGIQLKGEHVALITGVIDGRVRTTNTAQVRIEADLARRAKQAATDYSGAVSGEVLADAIRRSRLDFTSEPEAAAAQVAAIYALGQGGALTLLTGVAGSGKTTLLEPLVQAWQADTRFSQNGREVIGVASAWRQADALKEAGIERTYALQPLLGKVEQARRLDNLFEAVERGDFTPSRNTVLVIDEVSQIGPRPMLKLLELQATTGLTIKAIGDREQAQAIEAGDTIEIMRRVLPDAALPELLTTVRQKTIEGREIAALFRAGKAAEALDRKRKEFGTALMVGGDHDQVVARIADHYLARRDHHLAAGSQRGVTMSAPTNADVADLSNAVRARLQARGEIGPDERLFQAIDQRGETYDMPLARGDRVRLFRRTYARGPSGRLHFGNDGHIGNNGSVVDVVAISETGLTVRATESKKRPGNTSRVIKVGEIPWRSLTDPQTGRLLLGFGHALTIDAAQGISSAEHINALPRGTAGINAFKMYPAESRGEWVNWTMVAEAAQYEAVRRNRVLGDQTPITPDDLWGHTAKEMSAKPYKPLATDLMDRIRRDREDAVVAFLQGEHLIHVEEHMGRNLGSEAKDRIRAHAQRRTIGRQIGALDVAIRQNTAAYDGVNQAVGAHLQALRGETAEARRRLEQAAAASRASPGPGM